MTRRVRSPEASSQQPRPKTVGESNLEDGRRQQEFDSVVDSLRELVQAAADTGRDWKLIDALVRTMIDLVLETDGDLFTSTGSSNDTNAAADPKGSAAATEAPRLRLRTEYRLRLEAVIDSWSDDETADFLMIGTRQVRRRAEQGKLYFFLVNRKRRYPVWQFDQPCGVVEGVAHVGRALPPSWPVERVYAFMTTRSARLQQVTPAQWMLMKRDIGAIVASIGDFRSTLGGSYVDCADIRGLRGPACTVNSCLPKCALLSFLAVLVTERLGRGDTGELVELLTDRNGLVSKRLIVDVSRYIEGDVGSARPSVPLCPSPGMTSRPGDWSPTFWRESGSTRSTWVRSRKDGASNPAPLSTSPLLARYRAAVRRPGAALHDGGGCHVLARHSHSTGRAGDMGLTIHPGPLSRPCAGPTTAWRR